MMISRMLWGIMLVFTLCGCNMLYNDKFEFNTDEVWVASEPSIYFYGWNEEKEASFGVIGTDEGDTEICMLFNNSDKIVCERYYSISRGEQNLPADVIFRGTCKLGNDKLIVKDIKFVDDIFNGSVDTITFERLSLEEWLKETGGESVETTTEES